MKRFLLPVILCALLLGSAIAWALDVPYLSGHVNDTAQMLSSEAVMDLEARLTAYEDSTGNQLVVLTIASLEGEVLEDYALRVAETWKLGQEGADNGILLLIARDERKMRIEVGYGLEPSVTDAVSHYVINDVIRPLFRQGEFEAGISEGMEALMQAADGDLSPDVVRSASQGDGTEMLLFSLFWLGIVGVFTLIGLATQGCMGWFLYAFLIPFYAVPAAFLNIGGFPLGAVILVIYLVGYPLLKILLPKTDFGKKMQEKMKKMNTSRGGAWSSGGWASGGGWSSGGGGFSSGGFSGGGGSFGGGGSSGGW